MSGEQVQDAIAQIETARHFLFVPANRPERFDKAAASRADIVILDLEDSVPPDAKDEARENVRQWLDAGGRAMVRINAADTTFFEDDLAVAGLNNLIGIMLPKASRGAELVRVAALAPTVALIETALGYSTMEEVAMTGGVVRLAFGAIDFALDLDITPTERQLEPVRLAISVASRCAELAAPIDGVTPDFRDEAANLEAARAARALGFTAKLCIHPAQLGSVEQAMAPSPEDIELARRIVEADRTSKGSAVALDGRMIDRPIVLRAQKLLGAHLTNS